jgi:RNA polymerase sigma factor (sigma-70 family)
MSDDPTGGRHRLVAVFDRDRRRLTRFVQSRLRGDGGDEAEDIVADVMLRLFERADLLAQVEDLTAYLYRALGHAVTDFFRRRRANPVALQEGADDEQRTEVEAPDPAPDPEQSLALRQQRDKIDAALTLLSPAERAVWVAVEMEGWTFRQLAEQWGEPLGTLLSRKSRATKRLQKLLAGERT